MYVNTSFHAYGTVSILISNPVVFMAVDMYGRLNTFIDRSAKEPKSNKVYRK
jgi:hypothetical protein